MPALNIGSSISDVLSPQRISSALDESQKEHQELVDLAHTETKQIDEATQAKKDITAKYSDALTPPKLENFTPPPQTDVIQQFGSSAMWIATLGSLFTRSHLTTALNASAKVLNAYQQKDQAAAQQAFQEWKVSTDNAIKMHEFEMDAYRAAMETADTDPKGTEAKIRTLAAAYKNPTISQLLDTGQGLAAVMQYQQSADKMRIDMGKSRDEAELVHNVKTTGEAYAAALKTNDPTKIQEAKTQFEVAAAAKNASVENALLRSEKTDVKTAAAAQANQSLSAEIGSLIDQIKQDPSVVGTRGWIGSKLEAVEGIYDPTAEMDTPGSRFKSQMTEIREKLSASLTGSKYYSARRQEDMKSILPGLESFTSPQQALNNLIRLKAQLDGASVENPVESGGDQEQEIQLDGKTYVGRPGSWRIKTGP